MKISQILRNAADLVEQNKMPYSCIAISVQHEVPRPERDEARAFYVDHIMPEDCADETDLVNHFMLVFEEGVDYCNPAMWEEVKGHRITALLTVAEVAESMGL